MYNKVILVGNIGKEPVAKKVSDVSYCTFSLATNESYKDKNGEWQTKTEWHNIVSWRNTADYIEKHIKKGMLVCVEGKLRTRSWTDEATSKTMYATEVVIDSIKPLDRKQSNNTAAVPVDDEEDLPFN